MGSPPRTMARIDSPTSVWAVHPTRWHALTPPRPPRLSRQHRLVQLDELFERQHAVGAQGPPSNAQQRGGQKNNGEVVCSKLIDPLRGPARCVTPWYISIGREDGPLSKCTGYNI